MNPSTINPRRKSIAASDLDIITHALLEAVAVLESGVTLIFHACPHQASVSVGADTLPEPCPECGTDMNVRAYLRGWPPDIRTL